MNNDFNNSKYISVVIVQFIMGSTMFLVYLMHYNPLFLLCSIVIIVGTAIDILNRIIDGKEKEESSNFFPYKDNGELKKISLKKRNMIEGTIFCLIGFIIFEILERASAYKYFFVFFGVLSIGRLIQANEQYKRNIRNRKDKKD